MTKTKARALGLCLLAVGMAWSPLSRADGGHTGSGGDYLRELFEKARSGAVQLVSDLRGCSLPVGTDPKVVSWIQLNQGQLEKDIDHSSHFWTVDAQATCGWTTDQLEAGIYLSYPTCGATTKDIGQAIFTLIHESAHHFGVKDEKFADAIARAIVNSSPLKECENTGSPFDVNACKGPDLTWKDVISVMPAGSTIHEAPALGEGAWVARQRPCNALTGCGAWRDIPVELYFRDYYGNYKPQTEEASFSVKNLWVESFAAPLVGIQFNDSVSTNFLLSGSNPRFRSSYSGLTSYYNGLDWAGVRRPEWQVGYTVPMNLAKSQLKITRSCFRGVLSLSTEKTSAGLYYDVEYAVYGNLRL